MDIFEHNNPSKEEEYLNLPLDGHNPKSEWWWRQMVAEG